MIKHKPVKTFAMIPKVEFSEAMFSRLIFMWCWVEGSIADNNGIPVSDGKMGSRVLFL